MLANKFALESERNKQYLYNKYFKYAKKKVYKAIKKAIKQGSSYVIYGDLHYNLYLVSNINIDILFKINDDIKRDLTQEGFYVRKYQFGMMKDPFEYTIAWGDKIEEHKRIDEIQEKLMQEKAKKLIEKEKKII